jgi:transcriptional antiterminator RfaH
MAAEGTPLRSWYLVYSKPSQERLASENLTRQGYEVYLPMLRCRRRRARRQVELTEPMFPRYLFVHLDTHSDNWSPIRSTLGVSNLVRFGHQPARVPDELVAALREHGGDDGAQALPALQFKRGERVRIVDGPMAGYDAIFEAKSGRERVTVLLEIAGQYARVQISTHQLDPLG